MCLTRIARILRPLGQALGLVRELPEGEPSKAPPTKPGKEPPTYQLIKTSRGGPNMPKRQPCPDCRGWRLRRQKTMGGAYYYCSGCKGEFFVLANVVTK